MRTAMPMIARKKLLTVPAALALTLGMTVACGDDDTAVEQAEEAPGIQLVDGEQVTIEGEVQEVLSPNSFTLGGDETLVFSSENFDVDDDDIVEVTGTVQPFVIADVEQDFDLDFDDDLFVDYENELSVSADSVSIVEEG